MILAAPFLLVFTLLLGSADVVFGAYVDRLARLEIPVDLGTLMGHAAVALGAGWLLAGGLLHALRVPTAPTELLEGGSTAEQGPPPSEPAAEHGGWHVGLPPDRANLGRTVSGLLPAGPSIGFAEAATVLTTVDLLFGAFVVVQFAYLFGGRETLDVVGLSYSEYARRGFFELLAVAAIALPLVGALEWLTRRVTLLQRRAFQTLASAMVLLVVVILASAMVRMLLYEDAYGFTPLRVYSHAFMVWLAGLCVLLVMTLLAERRQWLVFGTFVAALVGITALGVLNPDRLIAEQNLLRYERGRPLDVALLNVLSADATPIVLEALDAAAARDDAAVRDALGSGLRRQLEALDAAAAAPWAAWNWTRAQAYAALEARRDELESYPLPGGHRGR
jgi:hypothetical protein